MIEALNFLWEKIKCYFDKSKQYTRPWNWSVEIISTSQQFTYDNGATGFMFTNTGVDIVNVNGKILYPGTPGTILGDSFSIAAHKDDVFKGVIKIVFATVTGPALEVVQISYMDVQQR